MSDEKTSDITAKNPKVTLLTTLTAFLEGFIHLIKDSDYRQIAAGVAPFFVLAITIGLKTLYKRYKCDRTKKMLRRWISDLEQELTDPHTTTSRIKEIKKEIADYKSELKSVEKDFIGFAFD